MEPYYHCPRCDGPVERDGLYGLCEECQNEERREYCESLQTGADRCPPRE